MVFSSRCCGLVPQKTPILRCKHTSTTVLSAARTGIRILLIQCIAVLGSQCFACGDIPPGHQPHGASRAMHRTMRVAAMVDVPGFILERLPVDIPAGVEGQERVMASGKAFRAFFLGHFLPPVWENLGILGDILRRKESLSCHARATYPHGNIPPHLFLTQKRMVRIGSEYTCFTILCAYRCCIV